jgi:hypothetical protein
MIFDRSAPRLCKRAAGASALLALAVASMALFAGCAQEGKTVETALPVQGASWDAVAVGSSAIDLVQPEDSLLYTMDVKFKLQTVYTNGCEARGGLELRAEGQDASRLFIITPLARYTADEDCNVGMAGDSLQTITVRGVQVTNFGVYRQGNGTYVDSTFNFSIRSSNPVAMAVRINSRLASLSDTVTTFRIRVEDKTLGLALANAAVRVEDGGTAALLSEGLTGPDGYYIFAIPSPGTAGSASVPYVIKVTYDGRTTNYRVLYQPALQKREEQAIVRV